MRASIHTLDLANGIKEALLRHGFTLHALAKISPSELAATLGIDGYVAKIISKAARRHAEADHLATETNAMMLGTLQF